MYKGCGSNSIGRVPAFQAGCCEFEPRLPLILKAPNNSGLLFYRFILYIFHQDYERLLQAGLEKYY